MTTRTHPRPRGVPDTPTPTPPPLARTRPHPRASFTPRDASARANPRPLRPLAVRAEPQGRVRRASSLDPRRRKPAEIRGPRTRSLCAPAPPLPRATLYPMPVTRSPTLTLTECDAIVERRERERATAAHARAERERGARAAEERGRRATAWQARVIADHMRAQDNPLADFWAGYAGQRAVLEARRAQGLADRRPEAPAPRVSRDWLDRRQSLRDRAATEAGYGGRWRGSPTRGQQSDGGRWMCTPGPRRTYILGSVDYRGGKVCQSGTLRNGARDNLTHPRPTV